MFDCDLGLCDRFGLLLSGWLLAGTLVFCGAATWAVLVRFGV